MFIGESVEIGNVGFGKLPLGVQRQPCHHRITGNHSSMPSCAIAANSAGRQLSAGARLTAIVGSNSRRAPIARKVSLGGILQAAISTSDQGVETVFSDQRTEHDDPAGAEPGFEQVGGTVRQFPGMRLTLL